MPYLTQTELEARVGGVEALAKLTDDDEDGAPDTTVIAVFLTELDNEFDSYFRAGGYTVPLTSAQASGMKRFMLDIANYRLRTRGVRKATTDDRMLYEDAMGVITSVAKRTILLDVVAGGNVQLALESDEPIFDRESLAYF